MKNASSMNWKLYLLEIKWMRREMRQIFLSYFKYFSDTPSSTIEELRLMVSLYQPYNSLDFKNIESENFKRYCFMWILLLLTLVNLRKEIHTKLLPKNKHEKSLHLMKPYKQTNGSRWWEGYWKIPEVRKNIRTFSFSSFIP